MKLTLLAVNCGVPRSIGWRIGRPARSAIIKTPVETENAIFGGLGIVGDKQTNRVVHGGSNEAVCPTQATIGRGGGTKKS